jgi:hypothetical protein
MVIFRANHPRKGEGGVSFKGSSVTLVTLSPAFSISHPSRFPRNAFSYGPFSRAEIYSRPVRKRVTSRNTTPGGSCQGPVRIFRHRKDLEHSFNHVATNASGIQSGMTISNWVIWTSHRTEKTKGGCRWGRFVRERRSVQTWRDRAASTPGQRYATK